MNCSFSEENSAGTKGWICWLCLIFPRHDMHHSGLHPSSRDFAAERADADHPMARIQCRLSGMFASLGIPPNEGFRLVEAAPHHALQAFIKGLANQEEAGRLVQVIRARQRECMGGRFGPSLPEQIEEIGGSPSYTDPCAVENGVLAMFQSMPPGHGEQ
jgi:hypothetical protein